MVNGRGRGVTTDAVRLKPAGIPCVMDMCFLQTYGSVKLYENLIYYEVYKCSKWSINNNVLRNATTYSILYCLVGISY